MIRWCSKKGQRAGRNALWPLPSPAPAAGFPSVMKISENNTINNELNSKHVSEEFVNKQINQLNVKKATGHDGISPKILKMASEG
jgi:hypothetical protein